nr:D493 [uncultured bacterium]
MNEAPPLDHAIVALARRERAVVTAGLAGAILLAWAYILSGAGMDMNRMDMDMPGMETATSGFDYFLMMFPMWMIMMAAMMLPGAAPMILLFTAISQKQRERGAPIASTALFTLGYLLVWSLFSVGATLLQWALREAEVIQHALSIDSPAMSAALMLGAGLWQITPVKRACLEYCRSPVHYISTHWRKGRMGALRMGLQHGAFCLGCCWFLMGLLFVGGIMNLYWIIGIAAYVLFEKLVPNGQALARISGVMLIGAGVWLGLYNI